MSGVLAVTWFDHRRTRELCSGLDVELALIVTRRRGVLRYLQLTARTIATLLRRRPRVLLVQNPSLVLCVLSVAMRSVLGYRLIADAHNEAVVPYENRQSWIKSLSHWVVRRADLTIVTNRQLAQIVVAQGGKPFVLPDRIPTPTPGTARVLGAGFNVVLIATFAKDEPIGVIFEAVAGADLDLYVTGNPRKLDAAIAAHAPGNVHFTGFLAEEDYWNLLRSADAIVDLTLKPDCLVCGAYEALALGKPMLLSDNAASTELFGDAAVFTDSSAGGVRTALERMRSEQVRLTTSAKLKCGQLSEQWQVLAQALKSMLAPTSGDERSV